MTPAEPLDVLAARVTAALTRPCPAKNAASLITTAAVDVLSGIDCASICVATERGGLDVIAPSDPLAMEADLLQQQLREGPTLDALAAGRRIDVADVAADRRWLLYGPKAAASGLAAQTAAPLHTGSKVRATLNLYSRSPGALDALEPLTSMFVSHAAVAWCGAVQVRNLSDALDRRKTIGQAIGIVMERYTVGEDAAFAFLTRASQTGNLKLRDVAAQIVTDCVESSPAVKE